MPNLFGFPVHVSMDLEPGTLIFTQKQEFIATEVLVTCRRCNREVKDDGFNTVCRPCLGETFGGDQKSGGGG
jgi:Zn finger protein HypA/HybF involved in hydrogenase expression